jgi:2-C-methyl-D-erythritol 4-phosphate cytidylyltransferase
MQAALPKQYLVLAGRPVLRLTLERLGSFPRLRGLLVGVAAGDSWWPQVAAPAPPRFLGSYTGGATRAETVLNGLRQLAARAVPGDWVLVHDAVRPCVRHADIDRLVTEAGEDGALLALPLADTVKRADDAGRVVETVPRERLWRALTPQLFRIDALTHALAAALDAGAEVTDEAAAMERAGARPKLVAGQADNIKITVPGDLALAELYLRRQEAE